MCLISMGGYAQVDLIDQQALSNVKYQKQDLGSFNIVEGKVQTFLAKTDKHIEKQHALSVRMPLNKRTIKKGQKLLIAFEAKTDYASLETDEAKVLWQLNVSKNSKERIRNVLSISRSWKSYYIPIDVDKNIHKSNLELVMQFGFPPQKFKIKNISLLLYDKDTVFEDLPRTQTTYQGIELDAPWRKEAFERIENIRKGNIVLSFTKDGEVISNSKVQIELIKHDFRWGVSVSAKKIKDNIELQNRMAKDFNSIVLTNDLKIKFFNKRMQEGELIATISQLRKQGLWIKGHVLIWPGYRHLTNDFKKFKNDPDKIRSMIDVHLENILTSTDGYVDQWDVVNEAYTNNDLQKITGGEEIIYSAFKKLRSEYPDLLRYVNEFGIINRGGLNKKKQEWYFEFVKRIDNNTDGAVQGIGIQSHIGTDLTAPTKVYELLNYYSELKKEISISEFTMDIIDPVIRQLYTEDFIITAFSHPSVKEFMFWGLIGDSKSKVDIYQENGELGSMGKAYDTLVNGLWKTKKTIATDDNGILTTRGIYGTYSYILTVDGEEIKGHFDHIPSKLTELNIEL